MESVMNRVLQNISLDGQYLTGFVFKSNVLVMFLNNGSKLDFEFKLPSINVNKLCSTTVYLTVLNKLCLALYFVSRVA